MYMKLLPYTDVVWDIVFSDTIIQERSKEKKLPGRKDDSKQKKKLTSIDGQVHIQTLLLCLVCNKVTFHTQKTWEFSQNILQLVEINEKITLS